MTPPRIAVLTGAGISAGSGVPTFRDAEGSLWRQYNPQELATPQAFRRDPALVWEFYDWRRQRLADSQPNAAHLALAEMDALLPEFTLVTQNIDGLHALAGSKRALYLHGDIWAMRCTRCDHKERNRQTPLDPLPPICPQCGRLLRPDVVWFGEALNPAVLYHAWDVFEQAELALVVGTSAVVYPAAQLPLLTLQNLGSVLEFNTMRTPLSEAATTFLGPCEETLPRWWAEKRAEWGLHQSGQ
ncbi:MAG: NAD-dependent deacylase [Caldilineales bacterium]|nr:NAD-dependent deacylase [Caldilineales bacterium]